MAAYSLSEMTEFKNDQSRLLRGFRNAGLVARRFAIAELGVERDSQKCPGDDQRAKDRQTDISFPKRPHGSSHMRWRPRASSSENLRRQINTTCALLLDSRAERLR
jgi:hypothetical protein